jgi:hypothetical protein
MNVRLASAYGWQGSLLELNAPAMDHRAVAQLRRCKCIRADKQMVLQRQVGTEKTVIGYWEANERESQTEENANDQISDRSRARIHLCHIGLRTDDGVLRGSGQRHEEVHHRGQEAYNHDHGSGRPNGLQEPHRGGSRNEDDHGLQQQLTDAD